MSQKKKNAAGGNLTAEVNLHSDFATKIINGQILNGYVLEIIIPRTATAEPRKFFINSSKGARSLLIMYAIKMGVTRAEALGGYFVLSITQHVSKMRHDWGLEIETERVPPTGYARYHLLSPITMRILTNGGE